MPRDDAQRPTAGSKRGGAQGRGAGAGRDAAGKRPDRAADRGRADAQRSERPRPDGARSPRADGPPSPSGGGGGSRSGDRSPSGSPRKPAQSRSQPAGSGRPGSGGGDRPGSRGKPPQREETAPVRSPGSAPAVPDEVTGRELTGEVRAELRTLTTDNAEAVSRHLVMAGRLLDEDPELAYRHATEARRTAARVGSVREAVGLAAYAAGRFAEALSELRAARRMSGSNVHLPVMADCERGLGRPERALAVAASPEASELDAEGRIEMRIVAAGARMDLGQPDAAVLTLQVAELRRTSAAPWSARLRYAYAEALLAAGRRADAAEWFSRATGADTEGETDAGDRLAELEGVQLTDAHDEESLARWAVSSQETGTRAPGEDAPAAAASAALAQPAVEAGALFVEPADHGGVDGDE